MPLHISSERSTSLVRRRAGGWAMALVLAVIGCSVDQRTIGPVTGTAPADAKDAAPRPVASRSTVAKAHGATVASAAPMPTHIRLLAGTQQRTAWFYFADSATGRWYIANESGTVLFLYDTGADCSGGICWEPINNAVSQDPYYSSAGNNLQYVSIAADGSTVSLGPVTRSGLDSATRGIAGRTFAVAWLYFTPDNVNWYISWAGGTAAVLYLADADRSLSGGILWQPVYGSVPGYTDPGPTFSSVSVSADHRVTTFGAGQTAVSSPTVTDYGPNPVVTLDGLQTVKLMGRQFQPGATVTIGWPGGQAILVGAPAVRVMSPETIKLLVRVGTSAAQWWVQINNPDGGRSSRFNFTVSTRIGYPHDGIYIGELNDVEILSGDPTSITASSYQCTEFAARYFWEKFQRTNHGAGIFGGNAGTWYANAVNKGLLSAPNGGTNAPRPQNILAFTGGAGGFGHVGIISEVGPDYVVIAQQNWTSISGNYQLAYMRLGMSTYVDGAGRTHYSIAAPSNYSVAGWMWPDASKF